MEELAIHIATRILKRPGRIILPDEPLLSSGLIDSFSLVDLALFVEDQYGVRIADTELNAQTFDSLAQLVTLIADRQADA
ncbi:MAG TPA: acyl carrier protein [Anaerolineales bacterium]